MNAIRPAQINEWLQHVAADTPAGRLPIVLDVR